MKKNKAQIFHYDLYGKREEKYEFLNENSIHSIEWSELDVQEPNFFFVYKDTEQEEKYSKGFEISKIFLENSSGITTGNDKELVSDIPFLENNNTYSYKPFDNRYIRYDLKKIQRARHKVMKYFIGNNKNIGLCLMRSVVNTTEFKTVFITKFMLDKNYYGFQSYIFPLYLYPDNDSTLLKNEKAKRVPNFNMEIIERIAEGLGLEFEAEKSFTSATLNEQKDFAPIDILDYIYAVLHSPTYREKYKEFLKIDFPRVPYPKDTATFWHLVKLGGEVRQLHLLESPLVHKLITTYPNTGNNEVIRKLTQNSPGFVPTENGFGQVWINDEQFFDKVPEIAWEFYIGGYQPAQKWLKDRVGRTLNFEEILHYQKIIVALSETDRLMKEIDKIEIS